MGGRPAVSQFGEKWREESERQRLKDVPEAWVGRRVSALMVRSGGFDTGTFRHFPLVGQWGEGVLESVNKRGIVASLSFYQDEEPSTGVFYPWGAVLALQPAEEG
jgi:hypothetical protein